MARAGERGLRCLRIARVLVAEEPCHAREGARRRGCFWPTGGEPLRR